MQTACHQTAPEESRPEGLLVIEMSVEDPSFEYGQNSSTGSPPEFKLVQSEAMKETTNSLMELLDVIETLRGPNGCPWDQEQEMGDIGGHLLEEACEVVDAIATSDNRPTDHVAEELGDVLMNVFMAAVVAEEKGSFNLAQVAEGIKDKLIRRHPHVFGEETVKDSAEVLDIWNSIKAKERGGGEQDDSPNKAFAELDRVPRSLPSVPRAQKITRKASRLGLDWPDAGGVIVKLREEVCELERAISNDQATGESRKELVREELGDILFTAINLCRKLDHSADEALRLSTEKFVARVRALEEKLGAIEGRTQEELDDGWEKIKEGQGNE
jgi:MazG family protein